MKRIQVIFYLISAFSLFLGACELFNFSNYTILYERAGLQHKSRKTFYTLVAPIGKLDSKEYKINIKKAIQKITREKGNNITICFFDDLSLLKKYYQKGLQTSTYHESKAELPHHIADYNGKYPAGNWLSFFPGLSAANYLSAVEQQYQLISFNPAEYKAEQDNK